MNYFTIGLVATAFVAGFITQGWRKDAVISEMVAAQSAAVAIATTEVMNDNIRLQKKKDDALYKQTLKLNKMLTLPLLLSLSLIGCGTTTSVVPPPSVHLPAPPLETTPQPQTPYSESVRLLLKRWQEKLTDTPLTQTR